MEQFVLSGNIVDLIDRRIFPGTIIVQNGSISSIREDSTTYDRYILPGFIDSHVHVESSMLIPSEFARLAVPHGTVATVSDPHEIGNVLGLEGVRYMIDNSRKVPFHFFFGASPCVPATSFETAGAAISADDIQTLFTKDGLKYLAEMMNYPGVLSRAPDVMNKIAIAHMLNRPIDGHAPGLKGKDAEQYARAGITTDHECYMLDEALDKIACGMKIIIREGSAAKNYDALHTLLRTHPDKVMFCSDDKHPHELVRGHINELVRRSIVNHGYDTMDVLRAASYNPIFHYKLDVGLLQVGDAADFIVVNNLRDFTIEQTYIAGRLVAENGKTLIRSVMSPVINRFNITAKAVSDFRYESRGGTLRVIRAFDGQLITEQYFAPAKVESNNLVSDIDRDILKIAVVNRYCDAPIAIGFINGFRLKTGAIASCIAHDSHNIIAVGVDDDDICRAVNGIIEHRGGISVVKGPIIETLPLPVAGIMSHLDGYSIAERYSKLDSLAKDLGTELQAPFMTLSFMALLVIPSLKLSDKGLFDGSRFEFTPLIVV